MKIYRYQQEEKGTGAIWTLTNWHTTVEGAEKELLDKYPNYSEEQMEEDLNTAELIDDLEDLKNESELNALENQSLEC